MWTALVDVCSNTVLSWDPDERSNLQGVGAGKLAQDLAQAMRSASFGKDLLRLVQPAEKEQKAIRLLAGEDRWQMQDDSDCLDQP